MKEVSANCRRGGSSKHQLALDLKKLASWYQALGHKGMAGKHWQSQWHPNRVASHFRQPFHCVAERIESDVHFVHHREIQPAHLPVGLAAVIQRTAAADFAAAPPSSTTGSWEIQGSGCAGWMPQSSPTTEVAMVNRRTHSNHERRFWTGQNQLPTGSTLISRKSSLLPVIHSPVIALLLLPA